MSFKCLRCHTEAHDPADLIEGYCAACHAYTGSAEDILRWPDGSWCYRHELPEMTHKSDDYETLPFGSFEWEALLEDEGRTP